MENKLTYCISVCHPKDISIWEQASKNILKYIKADSYNLVVPDSSILKFQLCTPKEFKIVGENSYLKKFNINNLEKKINKIRIGWYLQQFIKLEAIYRLNINENAILWDADTIPIKPLIFFDKNSQPIFYSGSEYHMPYFRAISALMGYDKIITKSFIAQCLPITFEIKNNFFKLIEDYNHKSWYDSIIDCIDSNEECGFSEYETLGTYISHQYPHLLNWNNSKWSRFGFKVLFEKGKKIDDIDKLSENTFDYDFLSFEKWEFDSIFSKNYYINKIIKFYNNKLYRKKILSKFLNYLFFRKFSSNEIDKFIGDIFSKNNELLVLQVGANDGIQSDPLRKYFLNSGNYSAILFEPIPYFVNCLKNLYSGRPDITIVQAAAGSDYGSMNLYYISPEIANDMNGDGPFNNWALGQGSFSKETVVYWIHNNSFRGINYKKQIKHWIDNIIEIEVPVIPVKKYIPNNTKNIFLVIDVQGFEYDVLRGLDWNNSPLYIMIEEDLDNTQAREYILKNNYELICDESDNLLFKLKNTK